MGVYVVPCGGDLIDTLDRLQQRSELDAILIETTGLADPAPVASTFFLEDKLTSKTRLDSFIALADAVNLEQNLAQSEEAQEQVAFADIILLNKADLVSKERLQEVEHVIRRSNPFCKDLPHFKQQYRSRKSDRCWCF